MYAGQFIPTLMLAAVTRRCSRGCVVLISLVLTGMAAACSETTAPVEESRAGNLSGRVPAELVAYGAREFSVIVGTTIDPGPAVRVLNEKGHPIAGVQVSFHPGAKVATSDAEGIARYGPWQLDTVAREYSVEVSVEITPQSSLWLRFSARATPGPAARLTAVGNNWLGRPGQPLRNQLYVRVTDIYNNPIEGVTVAFEVAGGGSLERTQATTDSFGLATAGYWRLGFSGEQRVSARAAQLEALVVADFCEGSESCEPDMAFVRGGAVWITGSEGSMLVAENARRPAWSPDGSKLAFFRVNSNQAEEAICITGEDFSNRQCASLDAPPFDYSPMNIAWSPDGKRLALARAFSNWPLLFLDVATMTLQPHPSIDGGVWSASWSADGSRMLIATDKKVYLANADGTGLQVQLTDPVAEVAWEPNGGYIAVVSVYCPWECVGVGLGVLENYMGGGYRSIDAHGWAPSWSPTGGRLAYTVFSSGMHQIRIASAEGGSSEVFLTDAYEPSWRR